MEKDKDGNSKSNQAKKVYPLDFGKLTLGSLRRYQVSLFRKILKKSFSHILSISHL